MKLVKEHINEKFTKDSDPIKDMKIGVESVDIYKKAHELVTTTGIESWLRYADSLIGKTISGYFQIEGYNVNKYVTQKYYEFEITNYASYMHATDIYLKDKNGNDYRVLKNNEYFISL